MMNKREISCRSNTQGMNEEEEEIWNESQTISGGEFLGWWEVLNEEEKLAWTSAKEKAKLSSQDKPC